MSDINIKSDIDEIADYIEDNPIDTGDKYDRLVVRLGGGTIKDGRFYAYPSTYGMVTDKIKEARKRIDRSDYVSESDIQEAKAEAFS